MKKNGDCPRFYLFGVLQFVRDPEAEIQKDRSTSGMIKVVEADGFGENEERVACAETEPTAVVSAEAE